MEQQLRSFGAGVFDGVALHHTFGFVYKSARIRHRLWQCSTLNGLLLLGSIALYNFVLAPGDTRASASASAARLKPQR